jgi:hypothetical protein
MSDDRFEHVFNCSVDDYWNKVFLNPKFNEDLFLGSLGFVRYEIVSQEENDTQVHRVVEAVPPMPEHVPTALKALIRKGLGYREDGVFNKQSQIYTVTVISHSVPERLHVSGETSTEAVGERQCRRIHKAHAKAKVLGISGLLESRILADVRQSYDKAATFTNIWIEQNNIS